MKTPQEGSGERTPQGAVPGGGLAAPRAEGRAA